jgi:hypothetical protein
MHGGDFHPEVRQGIVHQFIVGGRVESVFEIGLGGDVPRGVGLVIERAYALALNVMAALLA